MIRYRTYDDWKLASPDDEWDERNPQEPQEEEVEEELEEDDFDPENIYGLASIRQSIEKDRR
jgi:hypothetical protein